jgi:hypothetical protein
VSGDRFCAQSDVVYAVAIAPVTVGQSTAFITYNSTAVQWWTNDNVNFGTFIITITGTVLKNSGNISTV